MIKKDHTNKKKRKKKEMQDAFSYFEKISTKPQIQKKKIQKITLTINFEIQTFHWLFVFLIYHQNVPLLGFVKKKKKKTTVLVNDLKLLSCKKEKVSMFVRRDQSRIYLIKIKKKTNRKS